MSDFYYQDGQLFCEQQSLSGIAEQFGTPAYVYSRAALTRYFTEYQRALGDYPGMICYAVKANSNIAVLNILARLGSGFDIVSVGELERVLLAGGEPERIVFSGVGKTQAEMQRALEVGIHCFNVESAPELERLNRVAQGLGVQAPASLRVNPDVDARTHPYIATGLKENKFGIDIEDAINVCQLAATLPNIQLMGIDCHIGSQLISVDPFLNALDRILRLVDRLMDLGITVDHVDIGGGLGVTYHQEQPPSVNDYIQEVKARLTGRDLSLIVEPGRSIVAQGGVLLTRVEYLKPTNHKNFAIIDAGMNDNIRPSLYQAWQQVLPLEQASQAETKVWDLVGPVCETADFLAKARKLALAPGDVLALMAAGAYGFSMSSNYNSRNRPPELMVDGHQVQVVRERESLDDQIRGEHLLK